MKWLVILAAILAGTFAQECGTPQVFSTRVIAGTTARRGAWPWQILMMFDGRPGCGGSLVSPNWVVTAAHCVYGREGNPSSFSIRVGEHNWDERTGSEVDIQIQQVVRHPSYNPRTFENDVALLKLSQPAQFNQYVQPVCLPSSEVQPGTQCVLTGWGKIRHPGQMTHVLQQVNLPVVSNSECDALNWRSIHIHVRESMICGGDGGQTRRGGCHGDSGGPFVCNVGGKWELHGAVSHGSSTCDSYKSYTVFSRISYLKGWIESQIGGGGGGGGGGGTRPKGQCHAIGPWRGSPGMDEWCTLNCHIGNCPPTMCKCD